MNDACNKVPVYERNVHFPFAKIDIQNGWKSKFLFCSRTVYSIWIQFRAFPWTTTV